MAPESLGTKSREFSGVSQECPRATTTTPRGRGSCRGLQKHMYGGTSPSGGEKPLLVLLELAGKWLTRIATVSWVGFMERAQTCELG